MGPKECLSPLGGDSDVDVRSSQSWDGEGMGYQTVGSYRLFVVQCPSQHILYLHSVQDLQSILAALFRLQLGLKAEACKTKQC